MKCRHCGTELKLPLVDLGKEYEGFLEDSGHAKHH